VTAVVVGASAGLGRALAEALAAAGHDLVLVSSDARDLEATASDLRIRRGLRVVGVPLDLGGELVGLERLSQAVRDLGGADALLLPIGWTAPSDDITTGADVAARLVRTNLLSVVAVVGELLPELRRRPRASIVGFGSVAAVRGRGANMVYAASKRALETWFEGLRHACAGTPVRVSFYVLGFLDTSLAFGRRTPLPRADPAKLAARVVRDLGRSEGVVYHPRAWRIVSLVLPMLPFVLYKRLKS
jgi:NAD(P)-dependent dehydrogenase (short-subunit alcohol dehydrogenase family)